MRKKSTIKSYAGWKLNSTSSQPATHLWKLNDCSPARSRFCLKPQEAFSVDLSDGSLAQSAAISRDNLQNLDAPIRGRPGRSWTSAQGGICTQGQPGS